jgi:hypothetical protein
VSAGFGRLVLDDTVLDDPYVDGLDDVVSFEVISDDGPRYRIDRVDDGDAIGDGPYQWVVTLVDPPADRPVGSIGRRGFAHPYQYVAKRDGAFFATGEEAMLVNAVFQLIGETADRRSRRGQ